MSRMSVSIEPLNRYWPFTLVTGAGTIYLTIPEVEALVHDLDAALKMLQMPHSVENCPVEFSKIVLILEE